MGIGAFLPIGMLGAVAPPAVLATGVTTFSNVSTTQSCTAPAGTTVAGDFLMLLVASNDASGGQQERFWPAPSGWTRIGTAKELFASATVFYKVAAGGEGAVTLTVAGSGVAQTGVAYYLRISGVDPTNPINGVYNNLQTVATNYSPSGSGGATTSPNCLGVNIVAARTTNANLISVSGSGWSKTQDDTSGSGMSAALSVKPMPAIGQQTAIAFTCTNSTAWATMTVALNPVSPEVESGYPALATYSVKKGAASTTATSFVITPPSGIVAGDMLLLMVNAMTSTSGYVCSTPAGWNLIRAAGTTTQDAWATMFWKVAVGGEGNLTVSQSSAQYLAWWARVTSCAGVDSSAEFEDPGSSQLSLMKNLIPATTRDKCLLLGHFCMRNGTHDIDQVFGGGSIATVVEDTCANSINNCYSQIISGKAARAGNHVGDTIIHARVTGANSGIENRTAILAALYS